MSDTKKRLIELMEKLPPERVVELVEFAEFLESKERRDRSKNRDEILAALRAYRDVLPSNLASARQITYLRLAQLADQHHLRYSRRSAEPDANSLGALKRLRITMALDGDYENVRQFIYQLESGSDFIVIDSVAIAQTEPGAPLQLTLGLSTYYQSERHGA